MRQLIVVAVMVAAAPDASAQPESPEPPEPPEEPEPEPASAPPAPHESITDSTRRGSPPLPDDPSHTAATVADQPRPGEARNMAVTPDRPGEWALWIPRILLFPIRAVAEVVGYPVRAGIYVYEVYDLGTRVKSIFFNEEGTAGLFPVALVETGFGLNAGARLILRELFGSDAELSGRASFGGRFRQIYSLQLDTEETWKRFRFDLGVFAEIRPQDQFWGIGNGDEADEAPAMPVDPVAAGDFARQTRFRQRALRAVFGSEYLPHRLVRTRLSAALIDRKFDPADPEDAAADQLIEDSFDLEAIPGFVGGSRHLYAELELGLDTRHAPSYWEGPSVPTTGFLVSVFGGWAFAIADDSRSYGRYGFDAQRYFRIGPGPRVLALRVYLEGVTEKLDDISFYDLPQLGGPLLLRGYDLARFRDRVAGLASAEYQWDLSNQWLSGFVFLDVGRTYPSLDDLTFADSRVGFGGGLEFHTKTSYLSRFSVASSGDGGLFFNLSFDPVYEVKARVERR
jgi:hypothetical protein